jgi:hypothetical protein
VTKLLHWQLRFCSHFVVLLDSRWAAVVVDCFKRMKANSCSTILFRRKCDQIVKVTIRILVTLFWSKSDLDIQQTGL